MGYDPSECKVRVEAGEEVGSRGRKGSVVEKWGVAFFLVGKYYTYVVM